MKIAEYYLCLQTTQTLRLVCMLCIIRITEKPPVNKLVKNS